MVLKKRERILAFVSLGLLGAVVLYQVYGWMQGSHGPLQAQKAAASAELERINNRLNNANLVAARMKKWRQRSLPSDFRTAQSLYQNWLLRLAADARFSDTKIDASGSRRRSDVYRVLQFSFQARSSLDGLTQFLYDFYRADHLHQIVSISVTPEDSRGTLKIQMTVEALSLTSATSENALSAETSDRPLDEPEAYELAIAGRNLFAAYQPPPPPEPPAPPPAEEPPRPRFDPVRFAYLTGLTSTGDRPTAWIIARTSGDRYELGEGETFEIGEARCKMLRIGPRDADIRIDDKSFRVSLGKNLRDGAELSAVE